MSLLKKNIKVSTNMPDNDKAHRLERRSKRVTIYKDIFEIIAIFLAGAWALYTFVLKDSENINAEVEQSSRLTTNDWADSINYSVNYEINIHNAGEHTFTIDSIHIYYWLFNTNELKKDKHYLDYTGYISSHVPSGELLINKNTHPNAPIIGTYLKDQNHNKHFMFVFDSIKGKSMVFRSVSFGHHFGLLVHDEECTAQSTIWTYDCWERTKQQRK